MGDQSHARQHRQCSEKQCSLCCGVAPAQASSLFSINYQSSHHNKPSLHTQLHRQNSELVFSTPVTYITKCLKRGVWFSYLRALRATSSKLLFCTGNKSFSWSPKQQKYCPCYLSTCFEQIQKQTPSTFKQGRQHTFNPDRFCHTYHPYICANKKDTLLTPLHLSLPFP